MSSDPTYYEAKRAWQAQRMRKRKGRPACRRCGHEIVFVRSAKSGKKIPCDPRLDYGDGERTLVTPRGEMIPKAPEDVLGREPHFGTCPARQEERQEQKRQQKAEKAGCRIHRLK